jgi:hypothetical protein
MATAFENNDPNQGAHRYRHEVKFFKSTRNLAILQEELQPSKGGPEASGRLCAEKHPES